ncbi:MAG TPA: ATP-binding protein [Candidatus Eisenbacteria bacterium]|nr:ATP-binding protein [Candidatus Eisenbacteria bacterium]
MKPGLRLYVAGVLLAAAALLATRVPPLFAHDWGHYVAWLVIGLVSDTMWSATLSGAGTWSLSATAGIAGLVLWGTEAGLWISAVGTLMGESFVLRKPWVRAAFNAGQVTIATALAGGVFDLLGGRRVMPVHAGGALLERGGASGLVLPFAAVVLVYFAVNRALVSRAVAWSTEGRGWWTVLREDWLALPRLEVDAASFLLSPLMVISFASVGYPGVLLFYAPLFMIFQSDRRYVQLKQAEEENLRAARFAAKGELAAGIAHDLNNQLVAITSRAQFLLKDSEAASFDNVPRHAQIILEAGRRMAALAKGLTEYTRNQVNPEPLDLNGLVRSTIEFVKGDRRLKGVEWDVVLDPALPEMRADVGQIQNVFINLFFNAGDAMAEQPTPRAIHVRTGLDDRARAARVVVQDSGPGIRPEHLPRMFEFKFTTKESGHGFGLSTSHRTIVNHGGRITVDSPPGAGARFTILLPLAGPGGGR